MTLETAEISPMWTPAWRNESGRWWVLRTVALTRAQRDAGCATTVSAATPEALAKLVRLHDEIAALAEREPPGYSETPAPVVTTPARGFHQEQACTAVAP